jgi:hypothetical protein
MIKNRKVYFISPYLSLLLLLEWNYKIFENTVSDFYCIQDGGSKRESPPPQHFNIPLPYVSLTLPLFLWDTTFKYC